MSQPASSPQSRLTQQRTAYYDRDVDFNDLAKHDEDWAVICEEAKKNKWLHFQDPRIVFQLTKSLLRYDFGIMSFDLPSDRLCPPVPVRWNYIRWIQDLLDTTADEYTEHYDATRSIIGLDIGVGASAIYPLLACSTRPAWRMAGTDIDMHSIDYATRNVESNGLESQVKLVPSTVNETLIPLAKLGVGNLDFVMTNPPFYSSVAAMQASYGDKVSAPSAVCTGGENEMICAGGDVGFVSRLIEESLVLRGRVQWYTAMLGRLGSLHHVIAKFQEYRIANFAVTCLQAGHKTNRWAVGWSFLDFRPRNDIARHGRLVLAVLPAPTAQTIAVPLMSAEWAGCKVDLTLKEMDVRWQWRKDVQVGVMEASANVWSRAARRRKMFAAVEGVKQEDNRAKKEQKDDEGSEEKERGGEEEEEDDDDDDDDDEDDGPVALAVRIECKPAEVRVRWLRGEDHTLFQSYCGMLKRALTTPTM